MKRREKAGRSRLYGINEIVGVELSLAIYENSTDALHQISRFAGILPLWALTFRLDPGLACALGPLRDSESELMTDAVEHRVRERHVIRPDLGIMVLRLPQCGLSELPEPQPLCRVGVSDLSEFALDIHGTASLRPCEPPVKGFKRTFEPKRSRVHLCHTWDMPRRPSKPEHPEPVPRRPRDPNQLAFQVVAELTGTAPQLPPEEPGPPKNPAAVALGKLGGSKGGKARAANLSPEQRREIAKKAAQARWAKDEKGKEE